MTYVITEPCIDVKDKSRIEECPVDCIYEGDRMLYIHPDECGLRRLRARLPGGGHLLRGRRARPVEGLHPDQRGLLHRGRRPARLARRVRQDQPCGPRHRVRGQLHAHRAAALPTRAVAPGIPGATVLSWGGSGPAGRPRREPRSRRPPATISTSPMPSSSGVCDPVHTGVPACRGRRSGWAATTRTLPSLRHTVDSSDGCSPRSMGIFLTKAPFASRCPRRTGRWSPGRS